MHVQNTKTKLIGIAGKKGAGKDTAAQYLSRVYGLRILSFADPIKDALAVMFGVPVSLFHDPETKEIPSPELLGFSPRFLMQTLGTEWGRDTVRSTLWIDLLIRKAKKVRSSYAGVVVPDVRFDNEAEAIRSAGGAIWLIRRNQETAADQHPSEVGVSPSLIDFTIDNTRDLRVLRTQVGVGFAHFDRGTYPAGPNHG